MRKTPAAGGGEGDPLVEAEGGDEEGEADGRQREAEEQGEGVELGGSEVDERDAADDEEEADLKRQEDENGDREAAEHAGRDLKLRHARAAGAARQDEAGQQEAAADRPGPAAAALDDEAEER